MCSCPVPDISSAFTNVISKLKYKWQLISEVQIRMINNIFYYSLQSKLAKHKSVFPSKIDYSKYGLRIKLRGQVKEIQLFLDFRLIL
jgi:hypothetical protein